MKILTTIFIKVQDSFIGQLQRNSVTYSVTEFPVLSDPRFTGPNTDNMQTKTEFSRYTRLHTLNKYHILTAEVPL